MFLGSTSVPHRPGRKPLGTAHSVVRCNLRPLFPHSPPAETAEHPQLCHNLEPMSPVSPRSETAEVAVSAPRRGIVIDTTRRPAKAREKVNARATRSDVSHARRCVRACIRRRSHRTQSPSCFPADGSCSTMPDLHQHMLKQLTNKN